MNEQPNLPARLGCLRSCPCYAVKQRQPRQWEVPAACPDPTRGGCWSSPMACEPASHDSVFHLLWVLAVTAVPIVSFHRRLGCSLSGPALSQGRFPATQGDQRPELSKSIFLWRDPTLHRFVPPTADFLPLELGGQPLASRSWPITVGDRFFQEGGSRRPEDGTTLLRPGKRGVSDDGNSSNPFSAGPLSETDRQAH